MTVDAAAMLVLGAVGLYVLRTLNGRRLARNVVTYRLTFPRTTTSAQVLTALRAVGGLGGGPLRFIAGSPAITFEVRAAHGTVRHFVRIPRQWDAFVTAQLEAAIPGLALAVTSEPAPLVRTGGELRKVGRLPLPTDAAEGQSAGALAALAGATGPVVLRWTLAPIAARPPRDVSAAERPKYAEPLWAASCRVGASRPGDARQVLAAVRATSRPGGGLRRRVLPGALVAHRVNRQTAPWAWPSTLNAAELTGLLGIPIGGPLISGLTLAGARLLPAAPALPSVGRVLGEATGTARPIAQAVTDTLRHTWVAGPTGTGKSTLLLNMAVSDLQAGHGLVLLDPKADLADLLLSRIPPEREDDVIVLDPTDAEPVGLNVLAGAHHAPELVVDRTVSTFRRIYRNSWGVRTQDVLYAGLATLVRRPDATLAELPALLTNPAYRRVALRGLDDPVGLGPFWAQFEALSDAERAQWIGPVLNKLRSVLGRPTVRAVVGQPDGLDLAAVLRERKVLICRLPKGTLGEDGAALIGSLVMSALWAAVQSRAGLPPAQRHPVACYLDEWQDFMHVPVNLPDVLAQARGWGLALTLANQAASQLTPEAVGAVRANARTKVAFQLAAEDARLMSREFAPYLEPADLQSLPAFTAYAQLAVENAVQPPASLTTRPAPSETSDAAALRVTSRSRYGRSRTEVEAAIRARIDQAAPPVALGRGRRP